MKICQKSVIGYGGLDYKQSVWITSQVKEKLKHLTSFAPLHNPVNLEGIEIIEKLKPDMPQIAVFDTTFHRHIPAEAAIYAGPYDWIAQEIHGGMNGNEKKYHICDLIHTLLVNHYI